MKGKLSFMWRATLALVLVLSLGVVMAAPVSAAVSEPEVTVVPTTPGVADADYTITFVSGVALTNSTDTITIEFPTGTTLVDVNIAGTVETQDISTGYSVAGQRVRITVPASADIIAGETVDVVLTDGITNPPDGDYTLEVYTSQEPVAVTSETYMISEAVQDVIMPTLAPTTVGAAATYDITFTTAEALRTGDAIVIEFPVDTDISAVVAGDVTFDPVVTVSSATPVGQVLTITLGGDLVTGATTVTIANHIINPTTVLNPDPLSGDLWKLTVYTIYSTGTGGERIPVESAAYTLIQGITISQVGWLTVDEYVSNATPSDAFQIQTQTEYGNPVDVAADTTFTLTASSGAFYSDVDCTIVITTIEIGTGTATSDAFYYKGATATVGTVTITADEAVSQGWDIASTTILVNPKLELWGGGVEVGEYKTFAAAMAVALPDDTIKVAPSTYDGFTVNVPYLTIESTAGAATTTIEGTISLGASASNFVLGGATGKGFTLKGSAYLVQNASGASDVTISYNTFDLTDDTASKGILIQTAASCSGWTVTENAFIITDIQDQGIYGAMECSISELTVTNNTFTGTDNTLETSGIEICSPDITTVSTIISGNTITATEKGVVIGRDQTDAGLVTGATAAGTLTISSNTFDGLKWGLEIINADEDADADQDLVVVRNTFSNNEYAFTIDYGKYPMETDYLEPDDFTVEYNDFSGNTYAVYNNKSGIELTADNNYWGSATGPTIAANVGGTGDCVSADVDYEPWLNVSDGTPLKTEVITLGGTGWNLISLPLIPTDSSIETVLAGAGTGVTVNKVAHYTGGPAGDWLNYSPSAPSDLDTMNDGKGYWIDVSGTGTLTFTVTGVELAQPGQAPPTYDVVVGWNLIGVTSISTPAVENYLGSVMDTVQAMYLYNASSGAYTAVVTTDTLVTGAGYWLAVNAAGTIYP